MLLGDFNARTSKVQIICQMKATTSLMIQQHHLLSPLTDKDLIAQLIMENGLLRFSKIENLGL